jgi:hypothetical protein
MWFREEFVPTKKYLKEKKLPRKGLLILDSAPSHPEESELGFSDQCSVFATFRFMRIFDYPRLPRSIDVTWGCKGGKCPPIFFQPRNSFFG